MIFMTDPKPDMERVAEHYGGVDHSKGPAIYTRADLFDAIYDLGRFRDLSRERPNLFVDLMSGKKALVAERAKRWNSS